MGIYPIKSISREEAEKLNSGDYDISLKYDGTMISFIDGKLISPRCDRSDRYKFILDILVEHKFPDCVGEMFIDKPQANVFDISKRENWPLAKFVPFDLLNKDETPYLERMKMLDNLVEKLNSPHIFKMKRFNTFSEGWDYTLKHQTEGVVIRNNTNWFKVKLLQEVKIEISGHKPNKVKGTFILKNGSNISGTSEGFVKQFHDIISRGNLPIAEIEFPFITDSGKHFQPRLRQITEAEK